MNIALLDFETLDFAPTSVILSAAVVVFDIKKYQSFETLLNNTVSWKLDTDSQIQSGRTINEKTVKWWSEQSEEARQVLKKTSSDVTLQTFVSEFLNHCVDNDVRILMSRHIVFDLSILQNILDSLGIDSRFKPVPFWKHIDTPSFIAGMFCDLEQTKYPVEIEGFKAHIAEHDVAKEAYTLIYIYDQMNE